MSESYVRVPPDSTGKKLRAIERTISGETVLDEVLEIADPTTGDVIDPRQIRTITETIPVDIGSSTLEINTIDMLTDGTVAVKNTVEVTATALDIRTIIETIPVSFSGGTLDSSGGVSVGGSAGSGNLKR